MLADALEELARLSTERIATNELLLRLHQRGWSASHQAKAIAMLKRREWAEVTASSLALTAAGRLAAQKPKCQPKPKRRAKRRIPRGLF